MPTDVYDKSYCTTCGARYDSRAKYCGVDGTALRRVEEAPKPVESPQNGPRKCCPRCRTYYPTHAQFCSVDASKLVDALPEQKASAVRPADLSQMEPRSILDDSVNAAHISRNDFDAFLSAEAEKPGQVFAGKYFIERLLGEGGMAKVYLARHLEIEKEVVIKLMHNQVPTRDKDNALKRFLQEIKVTAKLNHPNLVSVFDGGDIEGRPYLVMEYIKGRSLRQYMALNDQLSFDEAVQVTSQMCSGLLEAHKGGVIHRDLKPENIMVRDDKERPDWVKVVDFGIAHLKQGGATKLTATGIAIGTVDYMSPEYLGDRPIDHRSDIYAVGIILHELLTGRCPFESENPEAIMAKHLWSAPVPPSSVRKDMKQGCALDNIVLRALEKDPNERFQSAAEMRQALQAAAANPAG